MTSGIVAGTIVVMVGTLPSSRLQQCQPGHTLLSLSSSLLVIGVLNTLLNVRSVMLQETVPDSYRGECTA